MNDVEKLDFEQLASALRSWVGDPVRVLIGPHKPPDDGVGMVWAKLAGTLHTSEEGAAWDNRPSDGPSRNAIAFQVGDDTSTYFVIYGELLTAAWWVSREHRFLIVEMGTVEIGIEASVRN
jgi:hypothetical protein